ncbi:hypothetical protein IFR05_014922, partial [Cadophora sp. M221]
MSTFIGVSNLIAGLQGKVVEELALFIGDGDEILGAATESILLRPHEIKVIGPLLDEDLCNHQDVPTDIRRKTYGGGGKFVGLTGLDIWWRPVRSKDEILAVLFENSRIFGFPNDLGEFEQGYSGGYSQLAKPVRDRIVYGGMTNRLRRYELGINRWKSIIKDPKEEYRTWLEYINGRRWLSDQPQVLTTGWNQPLSALPRRSNKEIYLLHLKHGWAATPYARTLEDLLRQIALDRQPSPISNIVCLGIGAGSNTMAYDLEQFMIVLQIAICLARENPVVLDNLFLQGPCTSLEMRDLFIKYGFKIIETPAAFDLIGSNTCLISPFVPMQILTPLLLGKAIDNLAMFVGDRESMFKHAKRVADSEPHILEVFGSMLDEDSCNTVDFPCDRPNRKVEGPYNGSTWPALAGLDI